MHLITTPLMGCFLAAFVYAGKVCLPENFMFISFLYYDLLFLSGLMVGVYLPDIDLLLPGLKHRSAITHSCLFSIIALGARQYAFAGGLALGTALHLSSDIQPKAWRGGALIKLPFVGHIGMLSPLWILVNITACVAILYYVLPVSGITRWIAYIIIAVAIIWYFHRKEKKRILPLTTLAFSALVIYLLEGGWTDVDVMIQRFI